MWLRVCRRSSLNKYLWPSRSVEPLFSIRFASTSASISPILIARARNLAAEHDKLSAQLAESYNLKLAKRIGELAPTANALQEWQSTTSAAQELGALLDDPTSDAELISLATDDLASTTLQLEELSQKLAASLTPIHPFASLSCLLEIRPGVGGDEAAIFAGDLLRMYRSFCTRLRLKASLISYTSGDAGGDNGPVSEAILEVAAPGSYGLFHSESGVHRVQRVPATESQGRTHTSAATVMVLPSFPNSGPGDQDIGEADVDDPLSDYYINPRDVRTDVMRAKGAGGQHVNKTDSAIRLTHLPTNTVVSMQESRSQHENRAKAWQVLRSRIAHARREKREERTRRLRLSILGIAKTDRSDKVRTYNYNQGRVTDHRSGMSVFDLQRVMDGEGQLEQIMESVKKWMSDEEVRILIAEEELAAKKLMKGK